MEKEVNGVINFRDVEQIATNVCKALFNLQSTGHTHFSHLEQNPPFTEYPHKISS
jgi:hypothetical protein